MKAGYYKQVAVLRQDGTNAATVLLGRLAVMSHNGRFFFFSSFVSGRGVKIASIQMCMNHSDSDSKSPLLHVPAELFELAQLQGGVTILQMLSK